LNENTPKEFASLFERLASLTRETRTKLGLFDEIQPKSRVDSVLTEINRSVEEEQERLLESTRQ